MAHGRNKYQSRDNRRIVRDVLMNQWDPIGIKSIKGAEDEYDAYVGAAYVKLMDERASAEVIAKYLIDTATGHMGMPPTAELRQRCTQTANTLISLRPSFESH
jgi:hypothetical protein